MLTRQIRLCFHHYRRPTQKRAEMPDSTTADNVVIGLDVGTTSVSAVAIEQSGRQHASVTINHHATVSGLSADCAEQNPSLLLAACVAALKQISTDTQGRTIAGIGVTGQMHSTVLLHSSAQPVGNVITWQDRRSLREIDGSVLLHQLQTAATENAMLGTGCRLSPGYMGTTLYSVYRLGQLHPDVSQVSFVADWIASQLANREPVTDRSHAASSGLYDLSADDWNADLLAAAAVNRDWLPRVLESGIQIGALCPALASRTSLPLNTPICNALGDNQASVLACLPNSEHDLLINIGTGGQIVWRVRDFQRRPVLDTRYLPPDSGPSYSEQDTPPTVTISHLGHKQRQYMMVGAGLCGGDALAWVNRTIQKWLAAFGVSLSDAEIWHRLHQQLDSGEADSLRCEPFFRGTRQNPERRAVFSGIDNENFTPGGVARSVLNGIAQSMFDVYQNSGKPAQSPAKSIVMSGNGARRNPLLVDAVARCFQLPVAVAPVSEEAATGAALLAGSRLGIWSSIDQARILCSEHIGQKESA